VADGTAIWSAGAVSFLDENLTAADEALTDIKLALAQLAGPDANRMSDPITSAIGRLDWNEKEIGTAVLHVDNIATTSVGAGAVANTDKAIEAIETMLRETAGGWFGAAADRFTAYASTVRNNLYNLKEELEQWAKDVAAEPAEQPISATTELKKITEDVRTKARRIALANEKAAATVLANPNPPADDPQYTAARDQVYEAETDVTKLIDIKEGEAEQNAFNLVYRHNTATVVIRDPNYATPITVRGGFAMNEAVMATAIEESEVCLAMLRDARNNLEAARSSMLYFGANPAAAKASATWVSAADYRVKDAETLIKQVAHMCEAVIMTRGGYRRADDESQAELDRTFDDRYEGTVLSGDPAETLPIEQHDPADFAEAHATIEDVLGSGWEGQGDLPDVVPPGSILGDDPGDGEGGEPI
jgi:hypothetical protein